MALSKKAKKQRGSSASIRHEERTEHLLYVLRVRKALRLGYGEDVTVEEKE